MRRRVVPRSRGLNAAIEGILSTENGQIFVGYLLNEMKCFIPVESPEDVAVQQFGIWLQGELDMFTTDPGFPRDYVKAARGYVKALRNLPRSPKVSKEVD